MGYLNDWRLFNLSAACNKRVVEPDYDARCER